MSPELTYILLGLAGAVITLLFGVLGYFLRNVHGDTKVVTLECGKNKGRIELLEKQLENDVKRIEQNTQLQLQNTQLEIRNLAQNVTRLSQSVEALVDSQLTRIRTDNP